MPRPPWTRQGSKYLLRNKIVKLIPPHETYVELFAGSASIFFNKPKAERNILNDLDKGVTNSFKMIMDAPLDIKSFPNPNTIEKAKRFFNKTPLTVQEKMVHHKIQQSYGFNNKPIERPDQIYKSTGIPRWLKPLEEWKEYLKGTTITNLDYEKVVRKYDGPKTFFFIDPPYEDTNEGFGYAEASEFDFERLVKVLKSIKGNFLLTINDSPRIRNLFKGFHIKAVGVYHPWAHIHLAKNPDADTSTVRKELFIRNYTYHAKP